MLDKEQGKKEKQEENQNVYIEVVKNECLEAVEKYSRQQSSIFSWPMDSLSSKPYAYDIHTSILKEWNKEGRTIDIVDFHRKWLSNSENIKKTLENITLI